VTTGRYCVVHDRGRNSRARGIGSIVLSACENAVLLSKPHLKQLFKLEVCAVPQCQLPDVVARNAAPPLWRPSEAVDCAAGAVLASVHVLAGNAGHGTAAVS
jgi:hypothetical protein